MQRRSFLHTGGSAGLLLTSLGASPLALAQSRTDSVRVLAEGTPNSRDPHGEGVSRESLGTFTNVYDRLIQFERTRLPSGVYRYDHTRFRGELAESWDSSADGRVLTFKLRRDAQFHDGTPVTAEAVKWSLDRAVSLPASKRQLATGSLTQPSQFTVLDPHTLRITLERADRYTLPNLALTFASVLNAELVRKHATAADPWGTEWVKNNAAGGGAYQIESWTPGQQIVYARFDKWKSGALPQIRRAVFQVVPAAATRSAALQRGDADIALELPPREIDTLVEQGKVFATSIPVTNTFRFVAVNTRAKPFDDVRVRQAVAYALPYTNLFRGASLGHGAALFGGPGGEPRQAHFPQPYPYDTQLQKARQLLAEAGLAQGFKTSFSYSVGDATISEPAALLIQEALAKVGIEISIEKVPAAQWGTLQTEKKLPFFIDTSSAWFNEPDYFFRIFFQGDWRWNFGSFDNAELARLLEQARWETSKPKYDALIKRAIQIAWRELPILPLWLPTFELASAPDLKDFTYYIHGQVDFRTLVRGNAGKT